jgi:hypothetical protein
LSPWGLYANPRFTSGSLAGLVQKFAYYGILFLRSLYLQDLRGNSGLITGLTFLLMRLAALTANLLGGQATARRLAVDCQHVILSARDATTVEEAAERLTREGFEASALRLDVTDETSVRAAAEEVDRRFGHLDVLVNNGWGPSPTRPTRSRPTTAWSCRHTGHPRPP